MSLSEIQDSKRKKSKDEKNNQIKQKNTGGNYGAALPSSSQQVAIPSPNIANISGSSNNNNNNNNINKSDSFALQQTPSKTYCLHGQAPIEVRDHCHRARTEGVDLKARRTLIIASVLCLVFMTLEIIGGILSNSLAVASDAAHSLTDFASFMISLLAIWIAGRPSTQRMSFGWYRAEVIGAVVSVAMIWVITAILVWLAVQRCITRDFELNAEIMLITSGLAILVNIVLGIQLHHGSHAHSHAKAKKKAKKEEARASAELAKQEQLSTEAGGSPKTLQVASGTAIAVDQEAKPYSYQNTDDSQDTQAHPPLRPDVHLGHAHTTDNINVRAAFVHVLGDMLQSVGVFVSALVIYFRPDWSLADPICTFIFSVIVMFTTFTIMKDALLVLMEGTPSYMHYTEVLDIFKTIEGVERVHNLRIWALSINKVALSVHLAVAPGVEPNNILQKATEAVHVRYNFFETTIQIENVTPQMDNCIQCSVPEK